MHYIYNCLKKETLFTSSRSFDVTKRLPIVLCRCVQWKITKKATGRMSESWKDFTSDIDGKFKKNLAAFSWNAWKSCNFTPIKNWFQFLIDPILYTSIIKEKNIANLSVRGSLTREIHRFKKRKINVHRLTGRGETLFFCFQWLILPLCLLMPFYFLRIWSLHAWRVWIDQNI